MLVLTQPDATTLAVLRRLTPRARITVGPDHIEIGSFMALAGVTGGELRIERVDHDDLRMIRLAFEKLGLRSEIDGDDLLVPGEQQLIAKREVPREAPDKVSFVTRAARADLYGDAFNDAVIIGPGVAGIRSLVTFDRVVVDGAAEGTGTSFGAMSSRFRLLQNGFIRSYALALLTGATVVVLALLAVNFS